MKTSTIDARCTIHGLPGRLIYVTFGASYGGKVRVGTERWFGVHLDGELTVGGQPRIDEWPADQVEMVGSPP